MISNKSKIIIAGACAAIIILGGVIYGICSITNNANNALNTIKQQTQQSQNSNKNKSNNDSINKITNNNNKHNANTKANSNVPNPNLNQANNKAVQRLNYTGEKGNKFDQLFVSVFGPNYTYPKMISNPELNFLKTIAIYQQVQMEQFKEYTDETVKNKGNLSEYNTQLSQEIGSVKSLNSMLLTLKGQTKDEEALKVINQLIEVNAQVQTTAESELGYFRTYNYGYQMLKAEAFGSNLDNYIEQYKGINNSIGEGNTQMANNWANSAQDAMVVYQAQNNNNQ